MSASEKEKLIWAQGYARLIESRFKKWQEPLGINGTEYRRYLTRKLVADCDDPLRKALIESIS